MTDEQKTWIDNASYESLLSRWRNAPVGSPWFTDDTGDYFTAAMKKRRAEVGDGEHVRASKSIGWEGGAE